MSILTARKVRKVYGKKSTAQEVLKGIDLDVEKGEFVGIMGASGSGKTTLLNVLCSIDQVTEGIVEINGQHLQRMKERELANFRRDELGFIFQEYNLLDTLTVKENILLPLSIKKFREQLQNRDSGSLFVFWILKELQISIRTKYQAVRSSVLLLPGH